MRSKSFVAGAAALLVLSTPVVAGDTVAECEGWAEKGECSLNPKYMLEHCADACARQAELDIEMADAIERKIGHITSFFDLEAQDIDENVITFDKYKGKVTVITNVASQCGENFNGAASRKSGVD